jgi:hypothetical protein
MQLHVRARSSAAEEPQHARRGLLYVGEGGGHGRGRRRASPHSVDELRGVSQRLDGVLSEVGPFRGIEIARCLEDHL